MFLRIRNVILLLILKSNSRQIIETIKPKRKKTNETEYNMKLKLFSNAKLKKGTTLIFFVSLKLNLDFVGKLLHVFETSSS